jgi:hypothetical protein
MLHFAQRTIFGALRNSSPTQLEASMILCSTATALVRHPLVLAVLLDGITRHSDTQHILYSCASDCGVPVSEVSFGTGASVLLLQRLFRDNGVSYDL